MNPNNSSPQQDNTPSWSYTSGSLVENIGPERATDSYTADSTSNNALLQWTASEFVSHDKTAKWYVALGLGAVGLSAIIFLLTRQLLSVIVIVVMALLFAVYASAKPRTLDYTLTANGLLIGEKFYPFNSIKSYSVIEEEGMPYIQLLMQKRLSVPIVVYVAPEQVDQIAETMGNFVPYDQKRRDIADKISSRIRF